jgi:hypothetical protein
MKMIHQINNSSNEIHYTGQMCHCFGFPVSPATGTLGYVVGNPYMWFKVPDDMHLSDACFGHVGF